MMSKVVGLLKLYARNILVGVDQLLGAFLGGDPDETISSRVGKWSASGSKVGRFFEIILDSIFGKNHCKECIEADEGKEELKF